MSNYNSVPGAFSLACHKILKQKLINFKYLFLALVNRWIMQNVKDGLGVLIRSVAAEKVMCI